MSSSRSSEQGRHEVEVAIVGTGFSGLAMAILLKRAGVNSFLLLEKAGEVGGTWRENSYPGAACDIPSHLYSFSFEPNPAWSHMFAPQAEILAYLKHCVRKYELLPHIRFHAEVSGAVFDKARGGWTVEVKDGPPVRARALVLGNGALHEPRYPDIPGQERFEGTAFHSALWRHDYDFTDKTVAVIGTGASAAQFVPRIAPHVRRLHLFQRTPPWIIPRRDRPLGVWRSLFERMPLLSWLYRAALYWKFEAYVLAFLRLSWPTQILEWMARRHLAASVADSRLRALLTPDYRVGCKRVLLSDDYYPALQRPNVELITEPIESIGPWGVRTRDGVEREVDAIVYGTGFNATGYLTRLRLVGLQGRELNETWRGRPNTLLGITVSGFPNLYLLMGPNTALGHNSMIFMIEAQARYVLQCIQALRTQGLCWLDVRPEVQESFNVQVQQQLRDTVWQAGGCSSWYQTGEGYHSVLWPGFTFDYWLRTRRLHLGDYQVRW